MKVLSTFLVLVLVLVLTLMHVQPNQAGRVLEKKNQLKLQSLDKGPVSPSGPSGCTFIPGSGGTNCPVKEINAAGNALRYGGGAAAYPRLMVVPFGVASDQH